MKKRADCHTWLTIKIFALMTVVLAATFLPGCLTRTASNESGNGMLTASLTGLSNADLVVSDRKNTYKVKADANGRFSLALPAGNYSLLMQSSDNQLVLIKRDISIENNLTFAVTNVDLIPIPNVVSVSVPLVYRNSAIIEWETDFESDGYIEYGSNEIYGFASYSDTELKKKHRIQIYDLLPDTTYHFRIVASRYNLDATRSYSRDFSFKTEP
jgi:hypothetical protein